MRYTQSSHLPEGTTHNWDPSLALDSEGHIFNRTLSCAMVKKSAGDVCACGHATACVEVRELTVGVASLRVC